jgi:hypothetical protein
MSHAHPLSGSWEGLLASSTPQKKASLPQLSTRSAPSTPQAAGKAQEQKPLNRQSHLLRLRNAGFRGPSIPTLDHGRGNPTTPSSCAEIGLHDRDAAVNIRERSPNRAGSRRSSPLGILEEIHNTTNHRRSVIRQENQSCQSSVSKVHANAFESPGDPTKPGWIPYARDQFELEESFRIQKPSLELESSTANIRFPIPRTSNGHQQKSSEFEATKYIDHLEAQLEIAQKQLQKFTSQSATKSQSNRLRTLTSESRGLRAEVAEWETKFNERIRSELESRINLENGLRSRIKFLEKEQEMKDGRIKDLEGQMRSLHDISDELHALQTENGMLKQRLHAVSMAVVSPSNGSEENDEFSMAHLASPTATRGQKCMLDLDSISSSPLEGDFESVALSAQSLQCMRPAETECPTCGSFMAPSQDSSTFFSHSRPNSMLSTHSYSLSTGSSVQSFSQSSRNRSGSQRKRMRRFSSGSSGPKKLLLPNSTIAAGGPTSAPPDMPQKTWDETTPRPKIHSRSRLSMQEMRTPRGLSSDLGRGGSWNDATTLASLEANYTPPIAWQHSPVQKGMTLEKTLDSILDINSETRRRRGRPQSLFAELSKARASAMKNDQYVAADCLRGAILHSRRPSSSDPCGSIDGSVLRKNGEDSKSSSSFRQQTVIPGNTRSVFSEIWDDPMSLSRTVIFNAWDQCSTSQSTRNFGWWFVGLLLGPIQSDSRKRPSVLDTGTSEHTRLEAPSNDNSSEQSPLQVQKTRDSQSNGLDLVAQQRDVIPLGACSTCDNESTDVFWNWIKLTAALVLAVGISIREGPNVLLVSTEPTEIASEEAVLAEDEVPRRDEEMIPECL